MNNHTYTPHYHCGVPVTDSCPVCGATGLAAARHAESVAETEAILADKPFKERLERSIKQAKEGKTLTIEEVGARLQSGEQEPAADVPAEPAEEPAAKRGRSKK